MKTITLKINERSKAGKAFLEMTNVLVKDSKGIEIVSTEPNMTNKEKMDIYNPEFVKMVLDRDADIKSGKSKCITVDPNDVWGSLGLK
ncbi:DUF2683 family protein [Flavobacterium sp.]|jgi:hypothetical protein|uniref:DUF2683 family protein n=1 Tax=Flavobacterium sp. TaxID=239 RepID=UPI0037C0F408